MAAVIPPYSAANVTMPGIDGFAVTPSDTVNFAIMARSLFIGGAGNVVLITAHGTTLTFNNIAAGTVLPMMAQRVNATNTTATTIVGIV